MPSMALTNLILMCTNVRDVQRGRRTHRTNGEATEMQTEKERDAEKTGSGTGRERDASDTLRILMSGS